MENNYMEQFHYDGEGYLEQPTDSNSDSNNLVKEYNDKKPLTCLIISGVLLVCGTFGVALIYGIATIMLNIVDALGK